MKYYVQVIIARAMSSKMMTLKSRLYLTQTSSREKPKKSLGSSGIEQPGSKTFSAGDYVTQTVRQTRATIHKVERNYTSPVVPA
jgi:hypothetical protein